MFRNSGGEFSKIENSQQMKKEEKDLVIRNFFMPNQVLRVYNRKEMKA